MTHQLNKCVFCLRSDGTFSRREHPIPESLGNDDLVLPLGCLCDSCNQYFGSKVEHDVLNHAPFSMERVAQAIRSKRGRYPLVSGPSFRMQSSGFWDRFNFVSEPPHRNLLRLVDGRIALNPKWCDPKLLVRFLLKMGIELLVFAEEIDPYAPQFDDARSCARYGNHSDDWDFAIGLFPNRDALVESVRYDEIGPLETRQVYRYEIGVMVSGDVIFSFMYAQLVLAVNLSRPPTLEYVLGFNESNNFALSSRWNLCRAKN